MRGRLFLSLCLLCGAATAAAELHPEQQLISALERLHNGHLDDAWKELDGLVKRQPNFGLAKLFLEELQAIRSGGAVAVKHDPSELEALAEEARLRLFRDRPPEGALPTAVLQIAPQSTHAVVVDLPRGRLYLLEHRDGQLAVTHDYYAGIGKEGIGKERSGDNRTPVGVYRITGFIPDAELAELYGSGAFPLDYPNGWDRRKQRTGAGIWLHGVPRDTYVRAPRSSEGCVTLANADLMSLKPHVELGATPVVLSDAVEWLPQAEHREIRESFAAAIEDWRARWSALDTDGYLAYYADDFDADGMSRDAFAEHKRRVNANKKFIDVTLSDLELYRYPGNGPLWMARFRQQYRSDNYALVSGKDQFWRRGADGRWQIIGEHSY